jgi:ORF6N domain-containing protein
VAKASHALSLPVEHITRSILVLRGHKVLLDEDLAALYGVEIKVLVQAVKRNASRFPEDFMLQLTAPEWARPRSVPQIPAVRLHRAGRSQKNAQCRAGLDRNSTGEPSCFSVEGRRRTTSHLAIVRSNEAIRKPARAILPVK